MVVRRHPKWSSKDLRDGFDALADLYYAYWGDFFHLAIFEEGDDPTELSAAYERTHERYFAAIGGPAATRVLELACGGGALTAWMADRTSGEVVGVDFSDRQLAHAATRVAGRPRPNLRFVRHDIMQLAHLNIGQFDAAICLDAACYLPDRRAALGQVATHLGAGARLLLVDWCQSEHATLLQRNLLLRPLCQHWAIAELGSVSAYRAAFEAAGFRILDIEDLSELVMPNWERGYRAALQALAEPMTVTRLTSLAAATLKHGARFVRAAESQVQVALLAKAAAESRALRYVSVLAERQAATASAHLQLQ
jgi:SAM-dependent methyltransferase